MHGKQHLAMIFAPMNMMTLGPSFLYTELFKRQHACLVTPTVPGRTPSTRRACDDDFDNQPTISTLVNK
jgi:hypothetical protein